MNTDFDTLCKLPIEELAREHISLRKEHSFIKNENTYLKEMSNTDEMTGLPNKKAFTEAAERNLSEALRKNEPLALLFIDLDNFKYINDTYGHSSGDMYLKSAATQIKKCFREWDIVARFGDKADEFAILLPNTDENQARELAKNLKTRFSAETFSIKDTQLTMHLSVGYVEIDIHKPDAISYGMDSADKHMYIDKEKGKSMRVV